MQNCFSLTARLLTLAAFGTLVHNGTAHAGIFSFGDFSQWTINQNDLATPPIVNLATSAIQLTTNASGEHRSIFYDIPQNISQFTASFTIQLTNHGTPRAAFVLQNSAAATHAVGDLFGYGGIGNSIAITLEPGSLSGFYTNGNIGGGSPATAPVDFSTNDPINVSLTYNGTLLQETLFDTATAATFHATYITNLPAIIGSPSAYVGITSNDSTGSSVETFSNSNFRFPVPEPSTFALLAMASLGLLIPLHRRRRR